MGLLFDAFVVFLLFSWLIENKWLSLTYVRDDMDKEYFQTKERFFRNLLLGEQWDLRNRYLHIHPTGEWSVQPNLASRTSTRQVESKSPDKFDTKSTSL